MSMCTTNPSNFYHSNSQIPISFTEWKAILSRLPTNDQIKLSSTTDLSRQANFQNKKVERRTLPRNQVFKDGLVDSFLVSSTLSLQRQDVSKILPSSLPTKRYVSSFKTLVNSTNNKQTQRLNYIRDSVMILKLSKENISDSNASTNSQYSSKHSTLSVTTNSTGPSLKSHHQQQQALASPTVAHTSPTLKIEGQKHRIVNHENSLIVPTPIDIILPINPMATTTTTTQTLLPSAATTTTTTNSTVFTYRSAAAGGNHVRQRAIAEPTSNSMIISAERFKTNTTTTTTTTTIRQTRPILTNTTSIPTQPPPPSQRNIKSRIQPEKIVNTKETYSYPDPFTNCPQEVLNKLAQLTKLQLETIDWEKKKRFTKKKPLTNTITQGKDSP